MKVKCLDDDFDDDQPFKPFSLNIVIESKQEFEDLLSRLNLPPRYVNAYSSENPWKANRRDGTPLFDLLDAIWEARGYAVKQEEAAE